MVVQAAPGSFGCALMTERGLYVAKGRFSALSFSADVEKFFVGDHQHNQFTVAPPGLELLFYFYPGLTRLG